MSIGVLSVKELPVFLHAFNADNPFTIIEGEKFYGKVSSFRSGKVCEVYEYNAVKNTLLFFLL